MNVPFLNPIYTEKQECQDCYKCVRNCPVKAIRVEAGWAQVVAEQCVYCGLCVEVCPHGAKRVRDDLPRARQLLASSRRVYASLAPSFVSEFPGVPPARMVAALRRLGFAGVSETALGAQQVSAGVAATMQEAPQLLISSACPSVVAWVQKHRPEHSRHVTALLSPLLTHCRMMRLALGEDIAVVFIGPCISKKLEADAHADLLDVALTFDDLKRMLEAERIDLAAVEPGPDDRFVPERAAEGAWYPVDGGMIAGIRAQCAVSNGEFMSFSGLSAIERALKGLDDLPSGQALFLELLACEGGCVNGPRTSRACGTAAKRMRVLGYGHYVEGVAVPRPVEVRVAHDYERAPVPAPACSETDLREVLRQVGKTSPEDELNCGGCGYDSCRDFARAMLDNKAERAMCVTYMRKLAQKKANALIQKMPSAVVIINEKLRVLECNRAFLAQFAPEIEGIEDAPPTLEGTPLGQVLPFHGLFAHVLKTGLDIVDRDLRHRDTILHLSIFTIEKHCVVGAIIQDVTAPSVQKERVIHKTQEVIRRHLETVQKIAYLLGENASESEIMLSQIIDSFSPPRLDEGELPGRPRALPSRGSDVDAAGWDASSRPGADPPAGPGGDPRGGPGADPPARPGSGGDPRGGPGADPPAGPASDSPTRPPDGDWRQLYRRPGRCPPSFPRTSRPSPRRAASRRRRPTSTSTTPSGSSTGSTCRATCSSAAGSRRRAASSRCSPTGWGRASRRPCSRT